RIMVTLPSEAATSPDLVDALVEAGARLARINCAHDDQDAWAAMIEHVRAAERRTGRTVRVAMDLAGPKLRTGPIELGPAVIKVRPSRDTRGRVLQPARVWLHADDASGPHDATPVPVTDAGWLAGREVGERLTLEDARGRRRPLDVVSRTPH